MKKKILIFGAGSIGNHFANACSKLKYDVYVTDISTHALERMKNKIYPTRYKAWDKKIKLLPAHQVEDILNCNVFDLVIIGTPPITHFKIFKKLGKFRIKNILIEKPLCTFQENPDLFSKNNKKTQIFCGYNHSVSKSFNYFIKKISNKNINLVRINWNENWDGILKAHFWLRNEFDSYLGNYLNGGGAIQEHSHGLHLLVILAKFLKININFKNIQKNVLYKKNGRIKYDNYASLFLKNNKTNFFLETNLIDSPTNKSVIAYFNKGFIKYIVNYKSGYDAVIHRENLREKINLFKKNRTSEFLNEVRHIFSIKNQKMYENSNISIKHGIETLKLIKNLI